MSSNFDNITKDLAFVMRKMEDVNVSLVGGAILVLRTTNSIPDSVGNYTQTLDNIIINNAIISHPLGNMVQLFQYLNGGAAVGSGLDLWELLPFNMKILFEGNVDSDIMAIDKGDIIVNVYFDENQNKIPIIFEVTKSFGSFFNKYMSAKKFELALYRGSLEPAIQTAVDDYVNNLTY